MSADGCAVTASPFPCNTEPPVFAGGFVSGVENWSSSVEWGVLGIALGATLALVLAVWALWTWDKRRVWATHPLRRLILPTHVGGLSFDEKFLREWRLVSTRRHWWRGEELIPPRRMSPPFWLRERALLIKPAPGTVNRWLAPTVAAELSDRAGCHVRVDQVAHRAGGFVLVSVVDDGRDFFGRRRNVYRANQIAGE